jgi:hypothetical protein
MPESKSLEQLEQEVELLRERLKVAELEAEVERLKRQLAESEKQRLEQTYPYAVTPQPTVTPWVPTPTYPYRWPLPGHPDPALRVTCTAGTPDYGDPGQ